MHCKTAWTAVLTCWLLVSTVGQHHMAERPFLIALGATMVATLYVSLRGQAWLEALRLGRQIERRRLSDPIDSADTMDLALYRHSRGGRAS